MASTQQTSWTRTQSTCWPERLRTALQIEMHLTLAFEHAFRLGEKRVSAEIVEQVLPQAIDELEPTLTRNGYDAPALSYAAAGQTRRSARFPRLQGAYLGCQQHLPQHTGSEH